MRAALNRASEWKGLVIWVLVMLGLVLAGCEPATDTGSTLDPLTQGPAVKSETPLKSIPIALPNCAVTFQGCTSFVVNNGPPISEDSELCPSFLNAKIGANPVLMASVLDHRVEWVFASGDKAESSLPMDGVVLEAPNLRSELTAGDNHVVVNRQWVAKDDKGQNISHHALTVLDRHTRAVVWHRVETGIYLIDIRLHADGSLVYNKTRQGVDKDDRYSVVFMDAQGRDTEAKGVHAMGPRANDRQDSQTTFIPVRSIFQQEMSWWNASDNTLLSVASGDQSNWVHLMGDHFMWVEGEKSTFLMIAAPGEMAEASTIQGISNQEHLEIHQFAGDRWLLLSNGMQDWRVELVREEDRLHLAGKALAIEFTVPEGLEAITAVGCLSIKPRLDEQGRLLMYLRDEHQATPYRYDVDGQRFEVIGLPTNRGMGGYILSNVDTYTIVPASPNQFMCMPMELMEVLDGPPGPSHQVTQPDLGVTFAMGDGAALDPFTVPMQSIVMHSTGMCFVETLRNAKMEAVGHRVRDVYADKHSPITFLGNPVWLP